MSDFRFDGVLTVHPTVLNIPFEVNKDNYSCSFQLTNITDRTVAYYVRCAYALQLLMLYRVREDTYVGTILPRSTSTVTLTVILKPTTEAQVGTQWIKIWAHFVKEGVEAEDITRENLVDLTKGTRGSFRMRVVFYTGPAVNFCSAIPENNLLHQFINDEVHGTTSEGKGSESGIRRQLSNEMSSYELFSDQEIKDATNGLSESSKIGEGGYGTVYKGILHDTEVAIKMLDPKSHQGTNEFSQEIAVLGRVRHPNLVKLIGACVPLHALVYEFLPHGSVEYCLQNNPMLLTWQIRTRIIYEICSTLIFLHSIKPQPVVHGDLKPANILLDANFISKLADFGLCRFLPGGTTTVAFLETNIKGTDWYIDPDFYETKKLTLGCDVYSFGITILRILTGKVAARIDRKVEKAIRTNSLMGMFDSRAGKWPEDVAEFLAYMGLECCEPERKSAKLIKDISTGLKDILAKIHIYDVVNDGVKAEDIRENVTNSLLSLTKGIRDKLVLHSAPHTANSSSRRKSENTRVKPSFKAFSPKEIQDATDNFSKSLIIGQGGYGKVYKCQLDNWDAAVKILDDQGDQGLKEYVKELEVLQVTRHENLIHLMGTCFRFRALVYEHLPNGSLEDCLKDRPGELTWEIRIRIVYEICTALRFLHANKPEPLVHGDLKPHNVLLGANFKVKLTDFGLCHYLIQGENYEAFLYTMNVNGSISYMDPDYLASGKVTPSVDVYSLGKTVVRILTGQFPPDIFREVYVAKRRGSFMTIVDPTVRDWPEDAVETLARFALRSVKSHRYRSEFMEKFYSDLQKILDGIDN